MKRQLLLAACLVACLRVNAQTVPLVTDHKFADGLALAGAYSSGTTYAKGDLVTSGSPITYYVSQADSNAGNALSNTTYWLPMSSGAVASLTVGTVTSLSAGATPTANITNGVLSLGIPAGATGPQGPAGSGASDATTSAKGSVQLAGDLSGTATGPIVSKIGGQTPGNIITHSVNEFDSAGAATAAQSAAVSTAASDATSKAAAAQANAVSAASADATAKANAAAAASVPLNPTDTTHNGALSFNRAVVSGSQTDALPQTLPTAGNIALINWNGVFHQLNSDGTHTAIGGGTGSGTVNNVTVSGGPKVAGYKATGAAVDALQPSEIASAIGSGVFDASGAAATAQTAAIAAAAADAATKAAAAAAASVPLCDPAVSAYCPVVLTAVHCELAPSTFPTATIYLDSCGVNSPYRVSLPAAPPASGSTKVVTAVQDATGHVQLGFADAPSSGSSTQTVYLDSTSRDLDLPWMHFAGAAVTADGDGLIGTSDTLLYTRLGPSQTQSIISTNSDLTGNLRVLMSLDGNSFYYWGAINAARLYKFTNGNGVDFGACPNYAGAATPKLSAAYDSANAVLHITCSVNGSSSTTDDPSPLPAGFPGLQLGTQPSSRSKNITITVN